MKYHIDIISVLVYTISGRDILVFDLSIISSGEFQAMMNLSPLVPSLCHSFDLRVKNMFICCGL